MSWNLIFAAALAVLLAGPAQAQTGATLVIHVQGVSPKGGILRLGLYDAASYPDDNSEPAASADVPAHGGETIVTLHDLRPGTYAIQAYQDTNSNDKMDTSWLGIPEEPFGFSRNGRPRLSKPAFDRVKFEVTAGRNVQVFRLQNF